MPLFRLLAAWAFTLAYWLALSVLLTLSLKRLPASFVQKTLRFWGRCALRLIGVRLELQNESTLEDRAPRVLVFNHQSALDMLWTSALCPPAPLAIGKKEIAWIPAINLAWWALDFILLDRANPRRALASIAKVPELIARESRSLIIAPEGTRSPDGSMLPFKRGAFLIAVKAKARICPVAISGAFELLPKQRFLPSPGVIRLRFLAPIETRGMAEEEAGELAQRVRRDILEAYEELRKG